MLKIEPKNWKLTDLRTGERFDASVPGDITWDLYRAGKVADPHFGLNHKSLAWIAERDYEYTAVMTVSGAALSYENLYLTLDGVDLFSEVYVNGRLAGKTENMFLKYRFDIKALLKTGENELKIKMLSTVNAAKRYDCGDYFACFNTPRIFLRKAQCHFGWDWAPSDMPGYGLWQGVYLECAGARRIEDVRCIAHGAESVTFIVELSYNALGKTDSYGRAVPGTVLDASRDELRVTLDKNPDGSGGGVYTAGTGVRGAKNVVNVFVENAELWWPNGYGAQPLYGFKVELLQDGRLLSEKRGRLAFRSVELAQEPATKDTVGYGLRVNGRDVFCKGSNWVPVECFAGIAADGKYEKLIRLAADANCNMLRVWGGGIYEKDIFYDLCDKYGIMVFQDFMFACSDLPEDNVEWVKNTVRECEYQVKRLRNHPCVAYWSGGNEKSGSFCNSPQHGDFFTNYILQGIVHDLDGTRPYGRQSPCGYTDVGNDPFSGDTHCNSAEPALLKGAENFRELLAERPAAFLSECASLGPSSLETTGKIFPADKMWPLNEYWIDRLTSSDYTEVVMPFAEREALYVRQMYGEAGSAEEFIAKGMTVHAEFFRAEAEYARVGKGFSSGFMNWMYNDIWPNGTWSVVDYYTEPKAAYYQMKRSYAPILVTFVCGRDGRHGLYIVNDTFKRLKGCVEYGQKTLGGETLWSKKEECAVSENGKLSLQTEMRPETAERADAYLYARAVLNGKVYKTLYSPLMWRGAAFESGVSYTARRAKDGSLRVRVKADRFAKSVFLSMPNNYRYDYSDNYFDLERGEEREITVLSKMPTDASLLSVRDYASAIRKK
ncbi:MAG: hypothetical protein LBL66_07095 [Clostridiales bacterium]|nr:hypothetical protein [Clostridiales bacterium]